MTRRERCVHDKKTALWAVYSSIFVHFVGEKMDAVALQRRRGKVIFLTIEL